VKTQVTTTTPEMVFEKPLTSKVEALAGYGLAAAEIARVLAMGEEALRSEYAHELAGGQIKANARVAESLFRKATGEGRESVTAAIFWLKTRARWKESSMHEHSSHPDTPITVSVVYETEPEQQDRW
jgi:hypothetical protein